MLRHALLLTAIFIVTGLAAREAFKSLRAHFTLGQNIWATRRAAEMIPYLENMDPARNSQRVLFLGSSDTVMGVRARDIEMRAGDGWEVVNLAFLGLDTSAMRLLIERYRETAAGQAGGLHSIYIGFQPTFYTTRFKRLRQRGAGAFVFESELYSAKMLASQAWDDPARSLQSWVTVHLFDGISPGESRRQMARLLEGVERERGVDRVWDFDTPALKGFDWERRGHFYFDAEGVNPVSRRVVAEFARYNEQWRKQVIRAYDGIELRLDEDLLRALQANIASLKEISQRVILFQPEPCDQLGVTEDGKARATEALHRVARESGAELRVFAGFTCDDYFDMLHLNERGQAKLTTILVEDLGGSR